MIGDFDRIDVRSRISASRLIEGGLAMFLIEAMNHHMEMFGKMVMSPLVRNRLRVLVDSWVMPARENRAGDESPWASIMARAPLQPHVDMDVIAAITSPIWATDE